MDFFFILLLIILTISSGFFSGSEVALFSLSSHKVKAYGNSDEPEKRKIAELLQSPRDLLVTVFMLNTLVNILLQNVASHLFRDTVGWTFKVGVPLVLTLLCGEIFPKYFAMRNNITIAKKAAAPISWFQKWLTPIRKITVKITDPISRLLFFFLRKEPAITKEEITHALVTAENQKILSHAEVELVNGYLDFLDTRVKELMTPKNEVLFYEINAPLTKLIHLFVDEKCTRIPVCEGDLDNVLGIVSATDFFIVQHNITDKKSLIKILKKPFYVPESTLAKQLLNTLYQKNEVMALAVDEYGTLTGLTTLEDIAEVVIGSVTDLRDQRSLYTRSGKNEIIASGRMELEELNALFGTHFESENYLTIGGWLTELFEGIPTNGTKFEKDGLFFHVLTTTPKQVERIYIRQAKKGKKS